MTAPVFNPMLDKHVQPKTKQIPWRSGNNPLVENDEPVKKLWGQLKERGLTVNDILYRDLKDIFSQSGIEKLENHFNKKISQLQNELIDFLNSQQLNELNHENISTTYVYDIDVMGNVIIQNTHTGEEKIIYGSDADELMHLLNELPDEETSYDKEQELLQRFYVEAE